MSDKKKRDMIEVELEDGPIQVPARAEDRTFVEQIKESAYHGSRGNNNGTRTEKDQIDYMRNKHFLKKKGLL